MGRLTYLSIDPTLSDVARFNALALESELRQGFRTYRWAPTGLNVDGSLLDGAAIVETSFLGGAWRNVTVRNSTFSGVFWSAEQKLSLEATTFTDVSFYGGEFQPVVAVSVAFINSKFRGATVDTTNFSKVRFATETPPTEGTPIVTPSFTLFERSRLISNRKPPEPGVIDLTQVGDDVVFDDVIFVDCQIEGWFRPEWFRNSTFQHCSLPPSLTPELLKRAGNVVE